ncbi:MAG: DUF2064 domain-containing protein [Jatrophihabitans sp.]
MIASWPTRLGTVLVIAKEPVSGRVKTRLVPPLTHDQAADVAGAALWDTLRAVGRVAANELIIAFDGDPRRWAPEGWRTVPQPTGGLDARLVAAFAAAGPGPAVLVGMDTPQVCADQLSVFDPSRYDACLGPATDGGYWAIGFADPRKASDAITGVPMSTDHTGADQLARLRTSGLRVQILDELTDVDTIDSARVVARLAPESAFATALARAERG